LLPGLRLHFEKQDLGQSRPEATRAGRGEIRRRRDRGDGRRPRRTVCRL